MSQEKVNCHWCGKKFVVVDNGLVCKNTECLYHDVLVPSFSAKLNRKNSVTRFCVGCENLYDNKKRLCFQTPPPKGRYTPNCTEKKIGEFDWSRVRD